MLRTVLSVVAGFGVMMVATFALFAALGALAPEQFGKEPKAPPGTALLLVILAVGLCSALGGGWTTAWISPKRAAVLGLVALVAVMGVVSWFATPAEAAAAQPTWYRAALMVVGIAGASLGGWLKLVR